MKLRIPILILALSACLVASGTDADGKNYIPSAFSVCEDTVCVAVAADDGTEDSGDPPGVTTVKIYADDKIFTYTDMPITPSDFTVKEELEKRRINAPLSKKTELIDEYLQHGSDYKTALDVCFPLLTLKVKEVADYLYRPPTDASVVYENGKYSVTKEQDGRALDEERTFGALYYSLKFFGGNKSVKAVTKTLVPKVTASELKARLILRGEYTTEYASSTAARAHNVAHAAAKLDGFRLLAGETLSFNAVVGERTKENGFETAKIIVDGKYVLGTGGGACQASTAVYNAALLAGLDATANAHSICPSYCPPGLDAMISTNSDLVIKNTTGSDLYFSVKSGGRKTTVKIYGAPCEYRIEPESVVKRVLPYEEIEKIDEERKYFDAAAVSGDRLVLSYGKDGYESTTYLKYYDKRGAFVKRVKIRSNTYKPTPQITVIAP